MAKLYNILKADLAGELWTNQYGKEMQTFFLNLEGIRDRWVMVNRQAGSPLLSGPTWLELTETTSKKGKPGYKAKVVQAPDIADQTSHGAPVQQPLPLGGASDTMTWPVALLAASTFATAHPTLKEQGVPGVLALANEFYRSKPAPEPTVKEEDLFEPREPRETKDDPKSGDTVVTDVPDGPIDLSDIPF